MARHQGPVLVDTNVIIELHRVAAWRALAGGYCVETVEECVAETQAGAHRRRPERRIDETELRGSLSAIHSVSQVERAKLTLRKQDIALDIGEESLWAHALSRDDPWILCGPDRASLRCGVRLGLRERLVPLERLLSDAGHRPRVPLRPAYTRQWLQTTLVELVLAEASTDDHLQVRNHRRSESQ